MLSCRGTVSNKAREVAFGMAGNGSAGDCAARAAEAAVVNRENQMKPRYI